MEPLASRRACSRGVAMLAIGAALWLRIASARRSVPVTLPSEYTQITNFNDSVVAPSLSPDGRMVTFKRGEDAFFSPGQIYVKVLPNGELVRLTNDVALKYAPVFTPDGSRIAYTDFNVSATVPMRGTHRLFQCSGANRHYFYPTRLVLLGLPVSRSCFPRLRPTSNGYRDVQGKPGGSAREIYFPANKRAMAHYAYASPDRKWVLVVEMDQTHAFHQPCRLVPFDGSSTGRQVGPLGTCTSAAWSPDGKWMYFGATVGRSAHLWRQRFPDGAPEQITFGPIEEEGIALAPDGRSLGDLGRNSPQRDLGPRRVRRAVHLFGRLRGRSPSFPRWQTRVLSFRPGLGVIGRSQLDGLVRRTPLGGPRLRKGRQRAAGRFSHGLRYFCATRRKRSSPQRKAEGRGRSGWRPSTAARHLDRLLRAEIKYPSVPTAISYFARSRRKRMGWFGSRKMEVDECE